MERKISILGYWLGLICTALALALRLLAYVRVFFPAGPSGGAGINYMTFLNGAVLFFLMAIASSCRAAKP